MLLRVAVFAIFCRLVLVSSTAGSGGGSGGNAGGMSHNRSVAVVNVPKEIRPLPRGGEEMPVDDESEATVIQKENAQQPWEYLLAPEETFELDEKHDKEQDENQIAVQVVSTSILSEQPSSPSTSSSAAVAVVFPADNTTVNATSQVFEHAMINVDGEEGDETDTAVKQKKRFFNRVARVSSLLLRREKDARLLKDGHNITDEDDDDDDDEEVLEDDEVTLQSDLTRPGRYIHIVTTASLPWMTGTAVNPLLRAAYLHERLESINKAANVTHDNAYKTSWVTLVIPWLELPEDQHKVYHDQVFDSPKEQEEYVRNWLRHQAGMPDAADHLNLVFYSARYHAGLGSVFAMGDIIQQLPQDELDVCVLEEPEQ